MHRCTPFRSAVPLLALLLTLACGGGEEPAGPPIDPEEDARLQRAMASLEVASKRVRSEVLRTCDKWRHLDRPCVENEVRREQLDCWATVGLKKWEHARKRRLRPYGSDRDTMMIQNLCMEKRRWRKIERSTF